jgi:pyrroline-5-carboxylate reductase
MTTRIGIIGSGHMTTEAIKVALNAKGVKDVIIVEAGEPLPDEIILPKSFGIEARPELLTPFATKMIEYSDFKDGKTSRRERRKRERKNR